MHNLCLTKVSYWVIAYVPSFSANQSEIQLTAKTFSLEAQASDHKIAICLIIANLQLLESSQFDTLPPDNEQHLARVEAVSILASASCPGLVLQELTGPLLVWSLIATVGHSC